MPSPDGCGSADELDRDPTGVTLGREGSRLGVCGDDTALVPDPAVLDYGRVLSLGTVRCYSLETGMTCQDVVTGSGFRVSRTAALVW